MSDGINVPIKLRTNEVRQMHEMMPKIAERLRNVDAESVQEQADDMERIYDEYMRTLVHTPPDARQDKSFDDYLSMPAEDWRTVVGALGRLRDEEGLRVWWLRKKLVQRLEERLEEFGSDGSQKSRDDSDSRPEEME